LACVQMCVEEGCDAPASVLGRGLVVADPYDPQRLEHDVRVIVEERVPGLGVLLDVMGNAVRRQGQVEPIGGAAHRTILTAVAGNDRARADKERFDVLGDDEAVVHTRYGEATTGRGQKREATAKAVADEAGRACPVRSCSQPAANALDILEGPSRPSTQVADH